MPNVSVVFFNQFYYILLFNTKIHYGVLLSKYYSDTTSQYLKTVSYEKFLNHANNVHYLVSFTANATGTESIYTVYEGHEIMFHVSTLLPHSLENKQQVI